MRHLLPSTPVRGANCQKQPFLMDFTLKEKTPRPQSQWTNGIVLRPFFAALFQGSSTSGECVQGIRFSSSSSLGTGNHYFHLKRISHLELVGNRPPKGRILGKRKKKGCSQKGLCRYVDWVITVFGPLFSDGRRTIFTPPFLYFDYSGRNPGKNVYLSAIPVLFLSLFPDKKILFFSEEIIYRKDFFLLSPSLFE
ncbi:hypothetical protein CDAR_18361 [Caerostris darwini]|uniref:Uncharacterized protein n=1 Tax=Caerostris darwini TaxID=1538125 RepID=A0AAV4VAX5_9ARAC|nr:hypothetical protein CDAR_18361 [Caerostris darwini]